MNETVEPIEYPPQQREASHISQSSKSLLNGLVFLRLFTLVMIAVLAVIATSLEAWKFQCLFFSVLAFVMLTMVEVAIWLKKPDKSWFDARALTESIKSLAWRYAVRSGNFAKPDDEADNLLLSQLREALHHFSELTLQPSVEPRSPITPWMKAIRRMEFAHRKEQYLELRVNDQIRWFSGKIQNATIAHRRWSLALIAVYVLGVVCALLEIASILPIDLLGAVGAVATSTLAWVQGKQHESLAREYSTTRNNLLLLLPQFENVEEEKWSALVDAVEDELAREHSVWQTQRRKPNPA